jgi:hypothetical protein
MVQRVDENLPSQWQDSVNLILGIWLAVSPWILPYAGLQGPAWNARITGLAIAVAAAAALMAYEVWKEWVNVLLAAWLIVSPWVFGYSEAGAPFYNQFIVGLAVGVLALWLVATTPDRGGLATRR